jgi:hypothetical protein
MTDDSPAVLLCARIEAHRDIRYHGGVVTDPLDAELYSVATWFRPWQEHSVRPDAPFAISDPEVLTR